MVTAYLPAIETLGETRFQFLSSSRAPEDVLEIPVIGIRKDVFLLGCVVHTLLFGVPPSGDPPEWNSAVDADGEFSLIHPWFERSLDLDASKRFASASEMLDGFNAAWASAAKGREIAGLDRFRSLKSQRQIFQTYPESALIQEDDRVVVWRSKLADARCIVKLWKGTALGDLAKEAPRILAFLERAEAQIDSPIGGTAILRAAHWTGDSIVLVQDEVEGPALSQIDKAEGPLSQVGHALAFVDALITIVNEMHARSIAHGDLKPSNILVTRPSDTAQAIPVLIDVLDFSPSDDGERMSGAYAPASGGRFERDRFAITKIACELLGSGILPSAIWGDISRCIEQCRTGPPANGTLIPLQEALARASLPPEVSRADLILELALPGAEPGLMLADEGTYGVSRFGSHLQIRGATELVDITLDSTDRPIGGRRTRLRQSAIQRVKRQELASFKGQVIFSSTSAGLSAIKAILDKPEVSGAKVQSNVAVDAPEEEEVQNTDDSTHNDELEERIAESNAVSSSVDIHRLWRRMVDLEAELLTEAVAIGESTYRRSSRRHVLPIQMTAGELDFDRNDTVLIERWDAKGRWSRIGALDIAVSSPDFLGIDSWADSARGPLVVDGARLRFQSRYENTSRERREEATSRILRGAAAAPGLVDIFQPSKQTAPRRIIHAMDDKAIASRYGLNSVQIESFKNVLECRPMGLLQGPPGTGKTLFIGALVHYALTHGLARNVLLASQSHEAVNNAAEAVLRFFGDERDSLTLIRVGHEGSVSEALRPYHVARVEKAYKDKLLATTTDRLNVVARSIGLPQAVSSQVILFEDMVSPVLNRIVDVVQDGVRDPLKLNSLKATLDQQLRSLSMEVDLTSTEDETIEEYVIDTFLKTLPADQAPRIEKFRHVIQLGRDIAGSVSTWQRSFETFLAGTRQVVAGTCVGLGRTSLGLTKTVFDLVVVDEAARCTPSELSVPIQSGKWVVLVGDHAQLEPQHPPEIIERLAKELGAPLTEIARSDFERTFESGYGRVAGSTLTKQYRMLPPIGRIVSTAFYERGLQHGRVEPVVPEAAMPPQLKKPLTWVNTDSLGASAYQRIDRARQGSLSNPAEADLVIGLLKQWSTHEPFVDWIISQAPQSPVVGVICSYAAQRELVWRKLQAENLPVAIRRTIKVDTIDSYQGKENPIVVLSLVRNNADGPFYAGVPTIRPGFMARKNRVNVAVSRAMDRLVIVGAQAAWKPGTPLGRIVEAFLEEVKGGEAVTLDPADSVAAPSTSGSKKSRSRPPRPDRQGE